MIDENPPAELPLDTVHVIFRQDGTLEELVGLYELLLNAAIPPRAAHAVVESLLTEGRAACEVPAFMDFVWLGGAIRQFGVRAYGRRAYDAPAAFLHDVRTRHRLSVDEFARMLGVEPTTLGAWEDGTTQPELAALHLAHLYDTAPAQFEGVAYDPLGPKS